MSEFDFDTLGASIQFKKGTSPLDAVEYLNVGREVWHDGTKWYLDAFVDGGGGRSAVRFVKGDYGEGKTHFLYLTAKAALDRDFVVSYVTAESARLDKFDTVYRYLVTSLRTRKMVEVDGLDFAGQTNGLREILDEWFRGALIEGEASVSDRVLQKSKVTQRVREAIDGLDADKQWDPNFRSAVQTYLLNRLTGTDDADEQNDTILKWLQGVPLPKTESRPFGAYEPIKADNSRDMVRSLILMLRAMGYRGLVALFDELERILEQAPKARNKAYQTVRQLLDNADGSGTRWLYILFAITGQLLADGKGFREYDALWERVRTDVAQTRRPERRAIVVDLEMTPFERDQLEELAKKVRAVHADAYDWEASARVTDGVIDAYVDQLVANQHGLPVSAPRVLVKMITDVLDRCEQDPAYVPGADVAKEIDDSLDALKEEETKIWD